MPRGSTALARASFVSEGSVSQSGLSIGFCFRNKKAPWQGGYPGARSVKGTTEVPVRCGEKAPSSSQKKNLQDDPRIWEWYVKPGDMRDAMESAFFIGLDPAANGSKSMPNTCIEGAIRSHLSGRVSI
jgi:hypothetical protein